MKPWRPDEIILHKKVRDDPVTARILERCPGVPVREVSSGASKAIKEASEILSNAKGGLLDTYLAGKGVLYMGPPGKAVDVFEMLDDRMMCPHFDRLKLASNGCPFQCDWCYLQLTYRAAYPYMKVCAGLEQIKRQIARRLAEADGPVMFNSGEMADSLALEHLTGHMEEMIPWFGRTEKGYLFMLTKADAVEPILELDHNGHTVVAWSMNAPSVSRRFELGAPPFERRLEAARKVQAAGYPVRVRLDPIVPVQGWRAEYAETIERIFEVLQPERVTLGTLRFEPAFYRQRRSILTQAAELEPFFERMEPMFEPEEFGGKTKVGKFSFSEEERIKIFSFAIGEIRKHSDCTIALCKESAPVWDAVGLPLSRCACVCQLESVSMSGREEVIDMARQSAGETIIELPLEQLDLDDTTFQFRLKLNVKELVKDLEERGQDFPIVVRPAGEKHQVVCGFRRLTALQEIGAETVKAVIRELDDDEAYQLSWAENEERRSYTDLDRANAILKGQQAGKKMAELEKLFSLNQRQLRRLKSLVDMPKAVKEALADGSITAAHAFALNEAKRDRPNLNLRHWIQRVVEEELTVGQLKRRITKEEPAPKARKPRFTLSEDGKLEVRAFTLDPARLSEDEVAELHDLAERLIDLADRAIGADIDVRPESSDDA